MIAVMQIALFTLVMAQDPFIENDYAAGPWFYATPARNPFLAARSSTTCLLRSQPVAKRDDYTFTPGVGGYKLHTRAVVWNEARLICEEEGGHLAIINSIAEANAIAELYNNSEKITGSPSPEYASIGFHDLYSKGQYVTIHGQSLARAGFSKWAAGEPNNRANEENCGSVYKSGGFNDVSCGLKYGFICEIPIY